jgi:DNA-binding GntR family transcriptional regulator
MLISLATAGGDSRAWQARTPLRYYRQGLTNPRATADPHGPEPSWPARKEALVLHQPAPLPVATYKQAAYTSLREMIVELVIPPGTRLVENELAAMLHVSKTPVREALALLEADGLVDVTPYRGATVRWVSRVDMEEQGFLVNAIELPAFPRLVEKITTEEIAELGQIVRGLKKARTVRDGRTFRRLTAESHQLMFQAVGYPRLNRFIVMLMGPVGLRLDRVFVDSFPDTWDLMLDLAVSRYEAIKARDADTAVTTIREHRELIGKLNCSRIDHELVAPYFGPQ